MLLKIKKLPSMNAWRIYKKIESGRWVLFSGKAFRSREDAAKEAKDSGGTIV
jgi:hypothetical protein